VVALVLCQPCEQAIRKEDLIKAMLLTFLPLENGLNFADLAFLGRLRLASVKPRGPFLNFRVC
jgi:hypothetical protein